MKKYHSQNALNGAMTKSLMCKKYSQVIETKPQYLVLLLYPDVLEVDVKVSRSQNNLLRKRKLCLKMH